MARTKNTELPKEVKPKTKKQERKVPADLVVSTVFQDGDNIRTVTKELTGNELNLYKLLDYNGLTLNDVKTGTILEWRIK